MKHPNQTLFEAPITAIDPEDEPRGPKPTKTKKASPFDFLNDLDGIGGTDNLPSAPVGGNNEPQDDQGDQPRMPRASADTTRSRTANIRPSDHMRDMLNRIDQNQNDEIDDAEAARRAGLGGAERPEPRPPGQEVDRVRPADVPMVLNRQLRAAGDQMPEWHTINNLPGYMQRAIRGMGRQMFGMMTRTPLEQIMTIANVEGQGPNTDAEMRAVAAWLRDNAEDRGPVQVSHGMAIPGYEPEVHEFTAMGLRFHVVRDPMGQYIYAYPEQDARTPGAQDRLPGRNVPRLNRESKMNNNKKTPVAESLTKHLQESLEVHKQRKLLEDQCLTYLQEMLLSESTLSKLIGDVPGGQHLVRWMHARHLLSNTAEWDAHPFSTEIARTEFKAHPDHFLIITASNGVAAIKPSVEWFQKKGKDSDWGSGVTGNNTTPYNIIAFRRDQQVDPALLRNPKDVERSADPSIMKARMGMIDKQDPRGDNIFDRLKDQIGTLQAIYTTSGIKTGLGKKDVKGYIKGMPEPAEIRNNYGRGVERDKIAKKVAQKSATSPWYAPPLPGRTSGTASAFKSKSNAAYELNTFMSKFSSISGFKGLFKRVGNLAMLDVRDEANDAMQAGSFERAEKLMAKAKKINTLIMSVNTRADIDINRPDSPIKPLIIKSLRDAAANEGVPFEEYIQTLNMTPGLEKLRPFMFALKANLTRISD
jgi:hypothetical protein